MPSQDSASIPTGGKCPDADAWKCLQARCRAVYAQTGIWGALGAQIVADGVVFTNPRWDAQGPTLIRQRSGSRSDDGALAERERPTRFQELFDMLV
jgi:hypothetical protein